ncbi:MAG: molybdate ABC transporter substrate-binding protein [Microbacteriaceae bacterium]|nr:molybdate ABC transporter substrate-binding protein [Burkholderiaceae bacterium]
MSDPFVRSSQLGMACASTLLWLASAAQADAVTVAVAANFAGPMARIAEGFAAASGHTLKVSTGSTGKFYSQILAGAPFEVLIAADDETPKKLIAEGHAVAGSNFTYAIGQLVLWSAQPGYVDEQGAVLAAGKFNKLAIANPKLAPYGRAGMEVIKAKGLTEALAPKLVTGESIAQAYQFVSTGNAELGFVALSQVIGTAPPPAHDARLAGPMPQTPQPPRGPAAVSGLPVVGSYWRVPAHLYAEIRQDVVLLKPGEKSAAAAALLAYLKSAPAQALIQAYGYGL